MDHMNDNMDDMDNLFNFWIIYGYNMYVDLYDYNMYIIICIMQYPNIKICT